MADRPLLDEHWDSLVPMVTGGRCILMLGPQAIAVTKRRVPLTRQFAEHLRGKLTPEKQLPPGSGFRLVSQQFGKRNRTALCTQAERFFSRKRAVHTPPLEDLAALPFKLVVSTTPDLHFDKVLDAQKGKKCTTEWYEFRGDFRDAYDFSDEEPLVYHLFGCIDKPSSLVLTENDLLEFLKSVIKRTPDLPETVSTEFAKPDTCFLFLGFNFRDWYMRILLHAISASGGENPSFALERFDAVDETTRETTALFYREGHNLQFFDMELDDFTAELRRRCEARLARPPRGRKRKPPPHAPIVFLCHASADKRRAEKLSKRLEAERLRTWLDAKDLRPGDRWDAMIKDTIGNPNEVHYFVVLQSEALLRKTEGYVYKEINEALERQTGFPKQLKFVIPVFIGKKKQMLEELKHLQSKAINLTGKKGMEELVAEIKRDWERRRKMQQGI